MLFASCGANFRSSRSIEPHSRSDTLSGMIEALADLESSALASLSSIKILPGLDLAGGAFGVQGRPSSVMGMMKDVPKSRSLWQDSEQ